ncbi:hypothetical protein PR048_024870 [Dryococelus australis]|uniref:Uncharacterized protein n=1 Tax=Dryococelus australis TaxID=614101 RepID=A0ABQ9GPS1_9NEOP|nr:hypothetical protein PR048_024870 [Dryococelus australis]
MERFKPFVRFATAESNFSHVDGRTQENEDNNEANLSIDDNNAASPNDFALEEVDLPVPDAVENSEEPPRKKKKYKKRWIFVYQTLKYITTKLDGTDHLLLGYAKTIKMFATRRQAVTKMKTSQLIMQQKLKEIDDSSRPSTPPPPHKKIKGLESLLT